MKKNKTLFLLVLLLTSSSFSCKSNNSSSNTNSSSSSYSEKYSTENSSSETVSSIENSSSEEITSNSSSSSEELTIDLRKNIILFIGDGMGNAIVEATARLLGERLAFQDFEYSCQSNTNSFYDTGYAFDTTDSAASATALATGTMTYNGVIGKDVNGNDLTTVLDYAHDKGYKTGILTTDKLYGATPAGFSSHANSRSDYETIIKTQAISNVDYLCGSPSSRYMDIYLQDFLDNGYTYNRDEEKMSQVLDNDKLLLQYDLVGNGELVHFKDAVNNALDFLSKDNEHFILMAEEAHIDKTAQDNDFEKEVENTIELNEGVKAALEFAKTHDNTVVIVTADHETGGLLFSQENKYENTYTLDSTGNTIDYAYYTGSHTNQTVGLYINGVDVDFTKYSTYNSKTIIKNFETALIVKDILDIE